GQNIIEDCWSEIIRTTVKDYSMDALGAKLVELGRRFYPDETVFPLKFLISKLEGMTYEFVTTGSNEERVDRNWVVRALLDIKVPFVRVFEVYQEMFESKLPPWSGASQCLYLVENITFHVGLWFEHVRSPTCSIYERGEFPARVVDEALSKYLLSIPPGTSSPSTLAFRERLHAIQSRIRSSF
ncbi:hypothetical protein HDU91_004501, partial [Kappamyces sp. JEL0680]